MQVWHRSGLALLISLCLIGFGLNGCDPTAEVEPEPIPTHGKIKPEFTDLSVGVLLTNAAESLSESDWTTKVQNRMQNFITNPSTATFMNPYPENAYSSTGTSVDVAWTCPTAIKEAWANTVADESSTVATNFINMLQAYASTARTSSDLIECHVINMEAPLGSPGGKFTGVSSVALTSGTTTPRVIRIILEYTP